MLSLFSFYTAEFLNQELILYRYSTCCCSSCRYKSDRDEIWREYSWRRYASNDGVGFFIWRHNFKMAAVTSFHAAKYCAAT